MASRHAPISDELKGATGCVARDFANLGAGKLLISDVAILYEMKMMSCSQMG